MFVPCARRAPSCMPSCGSSRALRVVHALLLLPCVFCNFPNFPINARYVPKPYSISTARISFRLLLQLYRSPYYDSSKPYFITYYSVYTKTSRLKGSVTWVSLLPLNKRSIQLKFKASMAENHHTRSPILTFAHYHNNR